AEGQVHAGPRRHRVHPSLLPPPAGPSQLGAAPPPGSQGTRGPVVGVPQWRSRASADERLVSPVVEHARQSETNWRAHTRGTRTSAPTIPRPKKDSRAIKT